MHHHLITHRPAWTPSSHRPTTLPPPSPPLPPLVLLLQQPHYNCISSEWAATSYLSSGMGSFMSAGHRFNTRPVGGMTGGLADWWTACLSVEAILLSDWTPFWRCWGHRRQANHNVLLGNIPVHRKLFWWTTWPVQWNIFWGLEEIYLLQPRTVGRCIAWDKIKTWNQSFAVMRFSHSYSKTPV